MRRNGHDDGLGLGADLDLDAITNNGRGLKANDELDVDGDDVRDRRLKEVLKRKQEAVETRKDARMAVTLGSASHGEAESAYRAVLEAFITAIQPLLHKGDGPHYWSEKEYGTLTLSPPGHAEQRGLRDRWVLPDGTKIKYRPDPVNIEIVGLKALFDLGDPIKMNQEIEVDRGHYGQCPETHTTVGQVTFGILDEMLIDLNNHIASLGIGIGTDDDDSIHV